MWYAPRASLARSQVSGTPRSSPAAFAFISGVKLDRPSSTARARLSGEMRRQRTRAALGEGIVVRPLTSVSNHRSSSNVGRALPCAGAKCGTCRGVAWYAMGYQRPTPTAAELQQGANDLLYEVLMLSNTAALLEEDSGWNTGSGWQSKTLYMALVEAFLTHARSLMDFVCPPSDYATRPVHERGIFAADYCSGPWKPQPWATLRQEHKQISTEIEHLSFDRPLVGRNWPYAAMRNRLREILLEFLDSGDRLSREVADQLRGVLACDVRVGVADAGVPGMAISTAAITGTIGVSGATTGMIDPAQIEQ